MPEKAYLERCRLMYCMHLHSVLVKIDFYIPMEIIEFSRQEHFFIVTSEMLTQHSSLKVLQVLTSYIASDETMFL